MGKNLPAIPTNFSGEYSGPERANSTWRKSGKFVLQGTSKKITYQLDDQEKPKDFAGQKVKVAGTYDKAAKTIHVEKIEAGS